MASPFMSAVAEQAADVIATLPGTGLPWLDQTRQTELASFLRDGLPNSRDERWKYTALRALERHAFAHGDGAAAQRDIDTDAYALPGIDGPCMVFVNGVFRRDLSQLDDLQKGLTVTPLSRALMFGAEPMRFLLSRHWQQQGDAFMRLNTALAADGAVIRVMPGCHVEKPLHIVHVGASTENELAWHVRNVIDLAEDASLTLVEQHVAHGDHGNLGTLSSDASLRENARLDWVMLQDASPKATLIRRHMLRQDARSSATIHSLEFGGKLVRNDLDIELRGKGASVETRGIFVPRERQHLDTHLDIRHVGLDTRSNSLWRGAADGRGHGVFHGQIVIDPGADGSDANLNNKNLLLSRNAAIDTQPVLEIYADEVMAVHGATVGQLDENALFYLRSRGVPKETARNLLTAAFCRASLDLLDNEPLRAHFHDLLRNALPIDEEL